MSTPVYENVNVKINKKDQYLVQRFLSFSSRNLVKKTPVKELTKIENEYKNMSIKQREHLGLYHCHSS